jgi:uncharacterized protein (DUF885 family)
MSAKSFDGLDRLDEEFWAWRAYYQPVSSDDIPRIERPHDWDPDWSVSAIHKQREELALFEERLKKIDSSGWPISKQVDYRLVASAFARVRWELDVLRSWERNPRFYVYQTLGALFEELLLNKPFDRPRSARVIKILERTPRLLEQGKTNLAGGALKPVTSAMLEVLSDVRSQVLQVAGAIKPLLEGESAARLDAAAEAAISAIESFRSWLEEGLPNLAPDAGIGREGYCFFLKNVGLVPLAPEQLLTMGRQEWERSMVFEAIAQERARGIPELPLFRDQAEQMAKEQEDEERIRRFLDEKNLLSVPSWMQHYRNLPMPAYIEPLVALGVADDLTSPTRLDEHGLRYIPRPSSDLGYFELSSARDTRPLVVHEGVPGHYLQMSISWAHENPIRRHYYDSGPNEGIGFYAEEMMLQAGLFDDSARTREVMYNFMRLRALRVEVDVKLALGLFSIDEATEYLRTRTPMDYGTARAEAIFFASLPGQAITYQTGKLQIMKFLADSRQSLGAKFDLRAFHDYLWKNGNVPIALLRWEYLGLDDEIVLLD